MKDLAATTPGASLLLCIPKDKFTREWVRQALENLFQMKHAAQSQVEGWRTEPIWAEDKISKVHAGQLFSVLTFWDPQRLDGKAVSSGQVANYTLDARNPLKLAENGHVWILVWLFESALLVTDLERCQRVADSFKRLVETLKPTFAAVDNYGETMVKRKGKDPRRFAWGAMYYDTEHVEKIGVEQLRSCSALIKQEYPDGGMWVQTWENPFIVAKELTQQVEKELGLKELFGAVAENVKAKPKRAK